MAKCLRCGADSSWIQGRTVDDEDRKRLRVVERDLKLLTKSISSLVKLIDAEMGKPSTQERGERIARWLNSIELQNDQIRHFTLGIDLKTGRKQRRKQSA